MAEAAELTWRFLRRHPQAAAEVLETLDADTAAAFLAEVPPRLAAPVMAAMLPYHAATCLALIGEPLAADLLSAMPTTAAAALLRRAPVALVDRLLEQLPARTVFALRLLLRYPTTTVGAWMEPDITLLPAGITVCDAWDRLRSEATSIDRFIYLVDREQRLVGRVGSAELLRADNDMLVDRLAVTAPASLAARDDLSAVIDLDDWRECDPLPVLSRDRRLLGLARHAALYRGTARLGNGHADTIFTDALMALMEAYWTGLSRLIEAPFSLLPPARRGGKREE